MTAVLNTYPGWSEEIWDICWLDCSAPGYYKRSGALEICLCPQHIEELETNSAKYGYKVARKPSNSRSTWWPWRRV